MAMSRAKLEVKDFDPRPPPVIRQGPQNQTLPINSEAMLRCTSLGEPLPRISWYKDERPVDDANDPRITQLSSGTLQISGECVYRSAGVNSCFGFLNYTF